MFDMGKVCEYVVALCDVESPEERREILNDVISEIRRKRIVREGYSSKEVESVVRKIVSHARIRKGEERFDYIKNWLVRFDRELNGSLGTWNFIIPIENMKLNVDSIKVGKVAFFTFTIDKRRKFKDKLWEILKNNPYYKLETKKDMVEFFDENVLSQLENKACAHVEVEGRDRIAQLKAYDMVEMALSILKLFLFSSHIHDPEGILM